MAKLGNRLGASCSLASGTSENLFARCSAGWLRGYDTIIPRVARSINLLVGSVSATSALADLVLVPTIFGTSWSLRLMSVEQVLQLFDTLSSGCLANSTSKCFDALAIASWHGCYYTIIPRVIACCCNFLIGAVCAISALAGLVFVPTNACAGFGLSLVCL